MSGAWTMKKYFCIIFLFLILCASIITSERSIRTMRHFLFWEEEPEDKNVTIVIDPGHGGRDPGKVGVNHCLEKDINLSISFLLKEMLEQEGITVIMTRDADVGLYSEDDPNKKRADLNNRVSIINSSGAQLAISIHQNSFSEGYVKGAQVFYYAKSEQGRKLAEMMQDQIKKTIGDGNHRKAKANDNYFMVTKTNCPLVIVECGYLSNPEEAELLLKEDYQRKMASGICQTILNYIEANDLGKAAAQETWIDM